MPREPGEPGGGEVGQVGGQGLDVVHVSQSYGARRSVTEQTIKDFLKQYERFFRKSNIIIYIKETSD